MTTFTLSVAHLKLEIEGPDGLLGPMFSRCLHPGGSSAAAPWRVHVEANRDLSAAPGALYGVGPTCSGGECRLEAQGFVGRVSTAWREASLIVHGEASLQDVGYFLRVVMALQAFAGGCILFHSAGIEWPGASGLAFFGRSGSGKSTVASFAAAAGARVLHDDLVFLCPDAGGWRMWGSPLGEWHPLASGTLLAAIFLLVQDSADAVENIEPAPALGELVANSPVVSADAELLPMLMDRWLEVMEAVPCRALHFRLSNSFIDVVSRWLGWTSSTEAASGA